MDRCPYCKHDLGDVEPLVLRLKRNKIGGEFLFSSPCCNRPLRAFSNIGDYYLEPTDGSSKPVMIGID